MTSTTAEKILGPGVALTLPDGRSVTLRYGMRGIAALDEHFGGIGPMFDQLQQGLHGPLAVPLCQAVAAGLLHKNAGHRLTCDDLLEELDPTCFEEYSEAVVEAVMQAFPQLRRAVEEVQASLRTDPAPLSDGTTGSTSPSSSADSTLSSSPT